MSDLICSETGIGVYRIESLRELDAIAAIACWGWDDRLRDMARSPDPDVQAVLDCQTDWQGNVVARLPRVSDPQTPQDLQALWAIQSAAQLALVPLESGVAWASISINVIQSPVIVDQPFRIWPHPIGTHVGKTQPIAICLGAIARHGRVFDLEHSATSQLLLPEILRSATTKIA